MKVCDESRDPAKKLIPSDNLREATNGDQLRRIVEDLGSAGDSTLSTDTLTDEHVVRVFAILLQIGNPGLIQDFAKDRALPFVGHTKRTSGIGEVFKISIPQDFAMPTSAQDPRASSPCQYARKSFSRARESFQKEVQVLESSRDSLGTRNLVVESLAYSSLLDRSMRLNYWLDYRLNQLNGGSLDKERLRDTVWRGRTLLSQHTALLQLANLQTVLDPGPSSYKGDRGILTAAWFENMSALADAMDDCCTLLETIPHPTGTTNESAIGWSFPPGGILDLTSKRVEEAVDGAEATLHSLRPLPSTLHNSPVFRDLRHLVDLAAMKETAGHQNERDGSNERSLAVDHGSETTTRLAASYSQEANGSNVALGSWLHYSHVQLRLLALYSISSYCVQLSQWLSQQWFTGDLWNEYSKRRVDTERLCSRSETVSERCR